jgi:acyl-CoA synthetase (AMP-forming)/AMP-acid ligase II
MNILRSLNLAKQISSNGKFIIFEHGRFTWEKFDQRTSILACGLKSLSIQRGDRIAVLMINSEIMIELYYACARIGAVIVPLNTNMNRFEILYILNSSEAKIFLIDEHFAFCSEGGRAYSNVRFIISSAEEHPEGTMRYNDLLHIGNHVPVDVDEEIHEDDPAALIYTCGSNDRPKSMMLTHKDLQWNVIASELASAA